MKLLQAARVFLPLRSVVIAVTLGSIYCSNGVADDVPAATQEEGDHSVIATTNGGIRDDELADFICQKINQNGGKVKDVKVMANACYGGGLLDDFQRVFGPDGACEGTPWVGGTASAHDEPSRGKGDKTVDKYPDEKLGSGWTDGLAGNSHFNAEMKSGVIRNGSPTNHVMIDFMAAGDNSLYGPNGKNTETPTVASGNGGDNINWRAPIGEAWGHEAIVFGGLQTHKRHHNNIENVTNALNEVWLGKPHNIQSIDGGSREDLFNAITTAASRLDENTQLVIYIDDHGGIRHNVVEALGSETGEALSLLIEEPTTLESELSPGWYLGLWGNFLALDPPSPSLDLHISNCAACSNWAYFWNGFELNFPSGNPTGPVSLPLPFFKIYPGMNHFEVVPRDSSQSQATDNQPKAGMGVLELSSLEVNSGAINELETDQQLIPAQSAAFYDPGRNGEGVFVELLDDGRAVVYVFTYAPDGGGQSWMLGFGEQLGFGIVITEMFLPTGPTFGPDFDPDDLVLNPFGALALAFPSCSSNGVVGILDIVSSEVDDYEELLLSTAYVQLTEIIDCQSSEKAPDSGYSGSWYDSSHNGEGVILEVLKDGTVVLQWFTFDKNGGQMWIQGTGSIENNILTANNLFTTSGTAYGSGFNQEDVVQTPWGSLTMEFLSCSEVTLKYSSTAGFGSGTLNMSRLTSLMGIPCEG